MWPQNKKKDNTMEEKAKAPQGVVAIIISKDGTTIAHAADFNSSCPGGFEQQEVQRIMAKSSLAMKAIRKLSSPVLSDCVERYDAEQILDKMRGNGCSVVFVPIGYENEQSNATDPPTPMDVLDNDQIEIEEDDGSVTTVYPAGQ
jgi:hypothetical protein